MDSDKKAEASKRVAGAAGTPKAAGGTRKFILTPSNATTGGAGTGTAAEQKGNYNNKLSNSQNEQKVDI